MARFVSVTICIVLAWFDFGSFTPSRATDGQHQDEEKQKQQATHEQSQSPEESSLLKPSSSASSSSILRLSPKSARTKVVITKKNLQAAINSQGTPSDSTSQELFPSGSSSSSVSSGSSLPILSSEVNPSRPSVVLVSRTLLESVLSHLYSDDEPGLQACIQSITIQHAAPFLSDGDTIVEERSSSSNTISNPLYLNYSPNISPRAGSPSSSDTTIPTLKSSPPRNTQSVELRELPATSKKLEGYKNGEIIKITMKSLDAYKDLRIKLFKNGEIIKLNINDLMNGITLDDLPAGKKEIDGYIEPYISGKYPEITMEDLIFNNNVGLAILFRGIVAYLDEMASYDTTAGPPAACKSMGAKGMMDPDLNKQLYGNAFPIDFSNRVIVDPDDALKMMPSFIKLILAYQPARDGEFTKYQEKVYKICRFASCLIAANALNIAFLLRCNIFHIRTSTPASILVLYPKIHKRGYPIRIHMFGARNDQRLKALIYREDKQASVQADKGEALTKADDYILRFPAYDKFANAPICRISMFWMENFPADPSKASTVLAATFNGAERTIHNEEAFKGFAQFYTPQIKDISADKANELISGGEFIQKYFHEYANM